MKKNSLIPLIVLAFVLILSSCQKENPVDNVLPEEELETSFNEGLMKLGKQLENPYSVDNMQKAYNNLKGSNQLNSAMTIEATHYYVRFLPANEQEYEMLKREGLDLFDFPLDYEMEEGGVYYYDPSIPVGQITWQYTAVPVHHEFSEIEYEIIENLYLQEEDDDKSEETQLKNASFDYFDWVRLENEALRITNNLDYNTNGEATLKSSSWNPSGYIRVEDDLLGRESDKTIPLEGVQVVVKRWFKWKYAYTDSQGYFSTGSFSSKVKYAIKWERHDFDIRSGSYGQAWYNFGGANRSSWNLNIEESPSPDTWLYAHIHRAAMTYYYQHDNWGIKPPPTREPGGFFDIFNHRLHIAGKDKSGTSHYYDFNELWLSAQVVVYSTRTTGIKKDSREVFGTTIHELAHASHWEIGYSTGQYIVDNIFGAPRLPESWAVGVETVVTRDVYGLEDYNYEYQTRSMSDMRADGYTSIVEDMIDDHNQSDLNPNRPMDNVSGYTLSQLEKALPGSLGSWWTWRDNIKEMYSNPTEEHLDALFQSF